MFKFTERFYVKSFRSKRFFVLLIVVRQMFALTICRSTLKINMTGSSINQAFQPTLFPRRSKRTRKRRPGSWTWAAGAWAASGRFRRSRGRRSCTQSPGTWRRSRWRPPRLPIGGTAREKDACVVPGTFMKAALKQTNVCLMNDWGIKREIWLVH